MPLAPPPYGIQGIRPPVGNDGMPPGYEGPGQRFLVGMQTPANSYVLGSGSTPQEMVAMHRRSLAQSFGMDPEGAEDLPDANIAQLGMQAMRGREQERLRAEAVGERIAEQRERTAAEAQQRAQEVSRRRAYLDREDPGGTRLTPVQKDSVASDPQLWAAHVAEGRQGEELVHVQAQKALAAAAAAKQAKAVGESLAQEFQNRPDLADSIHAMAEQGASPALIRASMNDRVRTEDAARKRAQAAADEKERREASERKTQEQADFANRQEAFKLRLGTTDEMLKFRERELATARAAHAKRVADIVKARDARKAVMTPDLADAWNGMDDETKLAHVQQETEGSAPSTDEYDRALADWQEARKAPPPTRAAAQSNGASAALRDTMSQLNPEWRGILAHRLQGVVPEHRAAELARFKTEMGIR